MPVEGPVSNMRDLGRKIRVDVDGVIWVETETKVTIEGYLVGTTVAGQERECRVSSTIDAGIVDHLLRQLVPRATCIWSVRVLVIGEGRAAGRRNIAGNNGEDGICHGRSICGLLVGIL